MKKLAQGFNTAAQDSNTGSLSRESGALPLSHCTFTWYYLIKNAAIYPSIHYGIYTSGDTERINETVRMQIKYLTNDVQLQLPEEGDRDTMKAIAKSRKMLVTEFLRR